MKFIVKVLCVLGLLAGLATSFTGCASSRSSHSGADSHAGHNH
jgi:hypothetical protein